MNLCRKVSTAKRLYEETLLDRAVYEAYHQTRPYSYREMGEMVAKITGLSQIAEVAVELSEGLVGQYIELDAPTDFEFLENLVNLAKDLL